MSHWAASCYAELSIRDHSQTDSYKCIMEFIDYFSDIMRLNSEIRLYYNKYDIIDK